MQYDANEFYPTPPALVADMLAGISLSSVSTVLEPSAGKGDIIARFQQYKGEYDKTFDIDAIELSPELRHILKGRKIRVVHDDFLTYETFKRYDLVIMNPPFSNGDKHLLKALRLVRGGGRLVCILNAETMRNPYTNARKELAKRLEELHAVIIPIHGDSDWDWGEGYRLAWGAKGKLCDIEKTFDYLAGSVSAGHSSLNEILELAQRRNQRHKVRFKHFTASFFKKGTCHLEFHDEKLIHKFNVYGGQQKGWLPPGYGTAGYEELEPEARDVVNSFEGEDSYRRTVANRQYFLVNDSSMLLLPNCG